MNDEGLNRSLRKFLRTVGVTGQREIETAVRAALADGTIDAEEALAVEARIEIAGIGFVHTVSATLTLA